MKLTFLGTGTSHGIPVIACGCKVCRSRNPHNTRTRSSVLITDGETQVIIDTGPDLRTQLLRENVTRLDAVLQTHDHADHLNGIDDVRVFTRDKPMPFYASQDVIDETRKRFSYIFSKQLPGGGTPSLNMRAADPEGFSIGSLQIIPIPVNHGCKTILGYRIGSIAYITDCSRIPEESYGLLQGVGTLIMGALRYRPHPTHFSIDQALAVSGKINPGKTYLTHFCHDIDHAVIEKELPAGVYPAYDGLMIEGTESI
jgi:phosphoribosyl 1,2-cyclic phosphate phosphodiesterase